MFLLTLGLLFAQDLPYATEADEPGEPCDCGLTNAQGFFRVHGTDHPDCLAKVPEWLLCDECGHPADQHDVRGWADDRECLTHCEQCLFRHHNCSDHLFAHATEGTGPAVCEICWLATK